VCNKLKLYFQNYGIPKEIGTDNGSEFNNKSVKKLLSSNSIKYIRGKPYTPFPGGM